MPEVQEDNRFTDPGLGEERVFDLNVELTQGALEWFDAQIHRLARDKGYFVDKPDGDPYSPHRIYEMTKKLGLGALTLDGNVDVIVPQLEVRHKENNDAPFAAQAQAREFAIQGIRLRAIQKFFQEGKISYEHAVALSGNHDPQEAMTLHQEAWQNWLNGTRKVQERAAENQAAEERTEVGTVELIESETEGVPPEDRRPASRLSRTTAPIRRRVIYAVAGAMVVAGMLLTACGPKTGNGETGSQPPLSIPSGEVIPPTDASSPPATSTVEVPPTEGVPDQPTPQAGGWPVVSDFPPSAEIVTNPINAGEVTGTEAVEKQYASLEKRFTALGYTVVDSIDALKGSKDVFIRYKDSGSTTPFSWVIWGVTKQGPVWPELSDGTLAPRPDWATATVSKFRQLKPDVSLPDGAVGSMELQNGVWTIVWRTADGKLLSSMHCDAGKCDWSYDPRIKPPDATSIKNGVPIKTVTENGKQVMYEWNVELGGWFESRMVEGKPIYLIGHAENNYELPDMIPMHVYFVENAQLHQARVYLRHPNGEGIYKTWDDRVRSWNGLLLGKLWYRSYGNKSTVGEAALQEWMDYFTKMQNGKISLPFTTPYGSYEWKPSPEGGYKVYVVNWDAADPAKDSRFIEWSYWNPGIEGRSMTLGDAKGNVIAVIASKKPIETLTDEEFRALILFPFVRVILAEDQSQEYYENKQWRGHTLANFFRDAGRGPASDPTHNPYIDIVTNP